MQLSKTQIETYRRDGVLPLGQVFDAATVAAARTHVEALRQRELLEEAGSAVDGDRDLKAFRLLGVSQQDAWFMSLVTRDTVLDAAESVLGPNLQYYQDNIFYKPPMNGAPTTWHQDNLWWKADPPNMLTIWIALDDTDADNGAVQYIPGSHGGLIEPELPVHDARVGDYKLLAPEQVDLAAAVSFRVPAGHAVMHHCLTVHGALPNKSQRSRWAYTVHLLPAGLLNRPLDSSPLLRGKMP